MMDATLARLARSGAALVPPGGGHRVDRHLVLLHVARQRDPPARAAARRRGGRSVDGAQRPLLPGGDAAPAPGRGAVRPALVQVGGRPHLDERRGTPRRRLLPDGRRVPHRSQRLDDHHRGRGGPLRRAPDRLVAGLRPPVGVAARPRPRRGGHGHLLRAPARHGDPRLSDAERARRLHPRGGRAGHHHGGQRVDAHHPGAARADRRDAGGPARRTGPCPIAPSAAPSTTATSPCPSSS